MQTETDPDFSSIVTSLKDTIETLFSENPLETNEMDKQDMDAQDENEEMAEADAESNEGSEEAEQEEGEEEEEEDGEVEEGEDNEEETVEVENAKVPGDAAEAQAEEEEMEDVGEEEEEEKEETVDASGEEEKEGDEEEEETGYAASEDKENEESDEREQGDTEDEDKPAKPKSGSRKKKPLDEEEEANILRFTNWLEVTYMKFFDGESATAITDATEPDPDQGDENWETCRAYYHEVENRIKSVRETILELADQSTAEFAELIKMMQNAKSVKKDRYRRSNTSAVTKAKLSFVMKDNSTKDAAVTQSIALNLVYLFKFLHFHDIVYGMIKAFCKERKFVHEDNSSRNMICVTTGEKGEFNSAMVQDCMLIMKAAETVAAALQEQCK